MADGKIVLVFRNAGVISNQCVSNQYSVISVASTDVFPWLARRAWLRRSPIFIETSTKNLISSVRSDIEIHVRPAGSNSSADVAPNGASASISILAIKIPLLRS